MQIKIKHKILIIIVIIIIIAFVLQKKQKPLQGVFEKNFEDGTIKINDKGKEREINVSFSGWFNPYDETGCD